MAELKDVIETLDKAADSFDGIAKKEQKKIYEEVIVLAKELETVSGKVKQSIDNLKRLTLIKAKLAALSKDKEWVAGISGFAAYFGELQKLQNAYYSDHFPEHTLSMAAKEKNDLMRKMAVQNTMEALMGDGLKANVTDKLNDILLRAVTTGSKFADLQEELRAHLLGKEGGQGAFARYATTYATTALSQYTGQQNKLLSQGLDTDWYMYTGSNKETTREFCEQLTKKKFIHKSEIPTILSGKIDDYQCAIYPKTGLPLGMIEGTTPENFQCNCGGWNCRHQLIPVADAVVPKVLRDKFKNIKPTAPQNEPMQADQPLDLTPYQEQIGKIEKYIEVHPKSNKIKGYLAQAMGATNQADLEAILKAAISDMNKFDAAKKANDKKKEMLEQAKVDQESKAKAAQMESAIKYVHDNLVGKYGGKAYLDLWQKISDSLKNGNAGGVYDAAAEMESMEQKIKNELPELVDPDKWTNQFTFEELKQANDYVKGHMQHWQNKGKSGDTLVTAILDEVNKYMDKSHPTYGIVSEAFEKKAKEILESAEKMKFNEANQIIIDYINTHNSPQIQGMLDQINALEFSGKHDEALIIQKDAITKVKARLASEKSRSKDKLTTPKSEKGHAKELLEFLKDKERTYRYAVKYDDIENAVKNGNIYKATKLINEALSCFGSEYLKANGIKTNVDQDYVGGSIEMIASKDVVLHNLTANEMKQILDIYENESGNASDNRMRICAQSDWKNLTKEERLVLTKYTETFNYLNEPLRNIRYASTLRTQEEYDRDVKTLTNALAKCKTTHDMVVRRGVSNYTIRELMKDLIDVEVGDVFTDGGFLSTAVHRRYGFHRSVNLVILIPKGSMGIYAEPFSHFNDNSKYNFGGGGDTCKIWNGSASESLSDEREWIGQRGSRFEVTRVIKDSSTVYLKLIGQLYKQP